MALLPAMIKPLHGWSSVGMTLAHTEEERRYGMEKALLFESNVLIESYIKGHGYTVAVLGNEKLDALPVSPYILPIHF